MRLDVDKKAALVFNMYISARIRACFVLILLVDFFLKIPQKAPSLVKTSTS